MRWKACRPPAAAVTLPLSVWSQTRYLSRNLSPPWQLNKLFFSPPLSLNADSQTGSCTNFSRRVFSLAGCPGPPLTCAKKSLSSVVLSFWRWLGVGDGTRWAASRFQPCLDCHIVWPCMSESTESSACPEWHHAPCQLTSAQPGKMCAKKKKKKLQKMFPKLSQNLSKKTVENIPSISSNSQSEVKKKI